MLRAATTEAPHIIGNHVIVLFFWGLKNVSHTHNLLDSHWLLYFGLGQQIKKENQHSEGIWGFSTGRQMCLFVVLSYLVLFYMKQNLPQSIFPNRDI